ncbi:Uncharacterised protein [Mycoplasmopsis edwardii]|uniref:Uncharacterized protein n=1 Tax=Mycoplasmopsis edwardii TaxID=53558 RepID=A0A3B0Q3S1_9BACT|nr:Uncharacterised protein [Mycoplasmopsis edwardii]
MNLSFLATKSVSELISTKTACFSFPTAITAPSAAILPAFLAAFTIPFSFNQLIAASIS